MFYELACGAPDTWKSEWELSAPEKFKILSTCSKVDGVDDKAMFTVLVKAMDNIGMTEAEKEDVFKTVAAVLHTGNIEFADDGSQKGGSKVKNRDALKIAATVCFFFFFVSSGINYKKTNKHTSPSSSVLQRTRWSRP